MAIYDDAIAAINKFNGTPFVSVDNGSGVPIWQVNPQLAKQLSPELLSWLNSYGSNVAAADMGNGTTNIQIKQPGGTSGTILQQSASGTSNLGSAPMSTNQDNSWIPTALAVYGGGQLAQGLLGATTAAPAASSGGVLDSASIYGPGSGWGGDTLSALDTLSGAPAGTAAAFNSTPFSYGGTSALGSPIYNNPTSAGSFASNAAGSAVGSAVGAVAGKAPGALTSFLTDTLGLSPSVAGLLQAAVPALGAYLGYKDTQNTMADYNKKYYDQSSIDTARGAVKGILNNFPTTPWGKY